jgi:hypothetical protein
VNHHLLIVLAVLAVSSGWAASLWSQWDLWFRLARSGAVTLKPTALLDWLGFVAWILGVPTGAVLFAIVVW